MIQEAGFHTILISNYITSTKHPKAGVRSFPALRGSPGLMYFVPRQGIGAIGVVSELLLPDP